MTLTKVSNDSSGNESNGNCSEPVITADGTQVAYVSDGTNLINNGSGLQRIFRTDLGMSGWRTTQDVFDGSTGDCTYPTISADGSRVSYEADATVPAVWVWDEGLGTSFCINPSNEHKFHPFMSADGLVIAYETPDLLGGMAGLNQSDTYPIFGSLGNDGPYVYTQLVDDDMTVFPESYHFNSIVHLRFGQFAGLSADGSSMVFDSFDDRILDDFSFPNFNEVYLRTGAAW